MKKYSLIICLLLCLTVLSACGTERDVDTSSGEIDSITEKAYTSTVTTSDTSENKKLTEMQKKPTQPQESIKNGGKPQTEESKPTTAERVVSKPITNSTVETASKSNETELPKGTTESTAPEIIRPTGAEISEKVVYYINQHREQQGSCKLTALSGMTNVAEYRSNQLITNFAHSAENQRKAYANYKYGEYVDMTEYGLPESSNYYTAYCGEAIAKGRWSGTADDIAKKIADGFRNSSGHWNYVGSADNSYIAVGCVYNASSGYWYCCVLVNNTNYG